MTRAIRAPICEDPSRDSSRSIHDIPPELLARIFILCLPPSAERHDDVGWIVVTEICRAWRAVALSCPELWSNIILEPEVASLMITRAKMAPLSFFVELDDDDEEPLSDENLDHIRHGIGRTSQLDLFGSPWQLQWLLVQLPSAPMLSSISVHNCDPNAMLWLDFYVFAAPPGEGIPRQLHLSRCAFRWESTWYSQLTELDLADLTEEQGPSWTRLFEIISSCPRLEYLRLANINTRVDASVPTRRHTATHLRTLHLFEPASFCGRLLRRLALPQIAEIHIKCTLGGEVYENFLEDVKALIVPAFAFPYEHVRVNTHCERGSSGGKDTVLSFAAASAFAEKKIKLKFICPHPARLLLPILQTLTRHREDSLHSVTVLDIDTTADWKEGLDMLTWSFFARCKSLQSLFVRRGPPHHLLCAIFERAMRRIGVCCRQEGWFEKHIGLVPGSPEQVFPDLEHIDLQQIDLQEVTVKLATEDEPGHWCSYERLLRATLWARWAGNAGVRTLSMHGCPFKTWEPAFATQEVILDGTSFDDLVLSLTDCNGRGRAESFAYFEAQSSDLQRLFGSGFRT
ncbi:hypothetical protein MKEN_01090300 [Mycena kentingensis (nom. inval.)]|nr:hypothetical protein MKEN_01090300 [Mycena kentingensis (nom. inval.)]